jgi:hypothetical protein
LLEIFQIPVFYAPFFFFDTFFGVKRRKTSPFSTQKKVKVVELRDMEKISTDEKSPGGAWDAPGVLGGQA